MSKPRYLSFDNGIQAKKHDRLFIPLLRALRATFVSFVLKQVSKYWPLLLPLILLLPSLNSFPYPSSGSAYSDLVVTHLPNALFLRRAIFEGHALPLWSPLILSGYPFAANPLSGLWYPPGWLSLLLPLPLGFNLLIAAHLLWGGIGMFWLLRAEGLATPAALFGGLAFELLPKFFAHYGAGHLTLLYAVTWTPWLLYSVASSRLKVESFGHSASTSFNFRPAIILALIFLADPRWAAYAGLLFCFYTFAQSRTQPISPSPNLQSPVVLNRPIFTLHFLIPQVFVSFLLSAPLAIPLFQYSQLSTRSQMTSTDLLAFSLPPARMFGLVFPDVNGFHEWALYPGALVFMLAVVAIVLFKQTKVRPFQSAWFWIWTAMVSLLYALGSNLPLLAWVGHLPGLDQLRVPSRALFVAGLALASLAACSIERIWSGLMEGERRRAGLLLTGLAGFSSTLTAGVWVMTGRLPRSFGWGTGILLAGVILTALVLGKRMPVRSWFAGLLLLTCLDLGLVDLSAFTPRSAEQVWAEKSQLKAFLSAQPGMFRVYSPCYSLPQHTAALAGLELADGVDPLQLEAYSAFMASASGVPQAGYSVTLPPMKTGDPLTANRTYSPDPALLGLLNVRFVAAEFDLPVHGLTLLGRYGTTRLYENALLLPRAWIQPVTAALGENAREVDIRLYTPNRIELAIPASGSSQQRLVLSELAYPGWRAWVDGEEAGIQVQAGLLRSLPLSPGPHQVTFAFRPSSLYWGLVLWASGVLIIIAMKLIKTIQNK